MSQRQTLKKTLFIAMMAMTYFLCMADNNSEIEKIEYSVESRATFSGGENTPFWLVSNIFGLGSPEFNNGFVRGKIGKEINPGKKFSWGAKVDLVGQWNLPASFRVQQLYGELKYRAIWVSLGSREIKPLYNNMRLSTGDLLFSGNAFPIPQITVGTYGFAPFWGTKGWFSIKAYLSYGLSTDGNWQVNWVYPGGNYAKNFLICGRGIWFKIGNEKKFPLTYEFGAELGTQFGGSIRHDGDNFKMPIGFIDWLKAVIPLSGGENTPEGEQTNIQGNMNGEYTTSVSYSPTPDWNIRAYWEHYFEDHSQMFFQYGLWKDGLWGVEVTFPRNPFISKFVYEFVATKDQTGAVTHEYTPEVPEQVSGSDKYYTHYLYGAWQTWGMSLGTPLAISPLYNRDHKLYIYNTRFYANHIGLEGNPLDGLNWRLLLTYSENWGTYHYSFTDMYRNFSGLFEINYNANFLKGFYLKGAIAWDRGKMLGNNLGGMISLGFQGQIHF